MSKLDFVCTCGRPSRWFVLQRDAIIAEVPCGKHLGEVIDRMCAPHGRTHVSVTQINRNSQPTTRRKAIRK